MTQEGYAQKLTASYDWLEQEFDRSSPIHLGHIALATALDWIEFRRLPGFHRICR